MIIKYKKSASEYYIGTLKATISYLEYKVGKAS